MIVQVRPVGWVEEPEFALYARHLQRLDPDAPRWRSNPSNPIGRLAGPDAVAGVWDGAFWQLATGTWTRGDEDAWRVGSLTKWWACPGLPIGCVIAPDVEAVAAIETIQPRWSVNDLALAVIEGLLPRTDLGAWADSVARRQGELAGGLSRIGLPDDAGLERLLEALDAVLS